VRRGIGAASDDDACVKTLVWDCRVAVNRSRVRSMPQTQLARPVA
jgi:hypothetical protein